MQRPFSQTDSSTSSSRKRPYPSSRSPFQQAPPMEANDKIKEEQTATRVVAHSGRTEVSFLKLQNQITQGSQWDFQYLKNVHPILKKLFPAQKLRASSNAGRLRFFLQNWQKLTTDPVILEIVQGWKLPIVGRPWQTREPKEITMSALERDVVDKEVQSMLEKNILRKVNP